MLFIKKEIIQRKVTNFAWSIFLLLFISIQSCFSQNTNPRDSMLIMQALNDVDRLIENSDFDSALITIHKNNSKITESKNPYLYALSQLQMGETYSRKGEPDSALISIKKVIGFATNFSHKELHALAEKQMGELYLGGIDKVKAETSLLHSLELYFEKLQNSTTATLYGDLALNALAYSNTKNYYEWLYKAQRLFDKINDDEGKGLLYSNIAIGYNDLKEYPKAIEYYNKCIGLFEKTNDKRSLAVNHLNLANLYTTLDSLELAKAHQQIGMQYAENIGSKILVGQAILNLALIHSWPNDSINNVIALRYENKAIELYSKLGNKDLVARRNIAAGILSDRLKDTISAINYFNNSILIAHENNNIAGLRDAYLQLCIHYKILKDYYNAYENLKLFIKYRDSISNENVQKQVEEIKTKYETEKKDASISLLNTNQRIQELELEKQKAIISGNKLEAIQKQNEIEYLMQAKELQELKINKQAGNIKEQLLISQSQKQQIELTNKEKLLIEKKVETQAIIRNGIILFFILSLGLSVLLFNRFRLKKKYEQAIALQKERMRISSDLHDDLGSGLTSINLLSEQLKSQSHLENQKNLDYITQTAGTLVDNMREIVWALNTNNDTLENLIGYIHESTRKMLDHTEIKLQISLPDQIPNIILTGEVRRNISLAIKETMNNAIRYSSSKNIILKINTTNRTLEISIEDDGIGFDKNNIRKNATGLKNIERRISEINGKVEYTSHKGCTIFHFEYPIG